MPETTDQARRTLLRIINGYRMTQVVHVAARLGLADQLAESPKSAEEIASGAEAHAGAVLRICRALVWLGLLEEADGRFTLTDTGELLREDHPSSLHRQAVGNGDEDQFRTWANMWHSVKTGETAFEHVHGMQSFEWFAKHPEVSAGFNKSMVAATQMMAPGMLRAYDFSPFSVIVDVGGGSGATIGRIMAEHEKRRGILMDTPSGLAEAPHALERLGVQDRVKLVEMDFFEAVPEGGDLYLLKWILHDWSDEQCRTILSNCRRVMNDDGTLVIIESVLPDKIDGSMESMTVIMSDLNMLVNPGGRERTEAEFRELLASSGLRMTRLIPIDAPWPISVIEAKLA